MKVGVAGAGAWGTALSLVALRAGHATVLWARDPLQAQLIANTRENARYLPGVRLPDDLTVSAKVSALNDVDVALFAVPAQVLRQTAASLAPALDRPVPAVVCAKGVERGSGMWMTQVLAAGLPRGIPAVLSGPSFAADVAIGLPTAVVLAMAREADAGILAAALGTPTFRIYRSDDIRGVEIGGAAKNVLAIASGIAAGRELGASAQAALVARSFAELVRFGTVHGARMQTLTGLSGLGDLVLTCNSPASRNFALGVALGRGRRDAMRGHLAEGAFTAAALVELARSSNVDMPIAANVDAVLSGRITVDQAIEDLLRRPQTAETRCSSDP